MTTEYVFKRKGDCDAEIVDAKIGERLDHQSEEMGHDMFEVAIGGNIFMGYEASGDVWKIIDLEKAEAAGWMEIRRWL